METLVLIPHEFYVAPLCAGELPGHRLSVGGLPGHRSSAGGSPSNRSNEPGHRSSVGESPSHRSNEPGHRSSVGESPSHRSNEPGHRSAAVGERLAVYTRVGLRRGEKFLPFQGNVQLAGVDVHLEGFLPEDDIRNKFGCLDVIQELDLTRKIRHCNWVRFLTVQPEHRRANVAATLTDEQPLFLVLDDILPNTLVSVDFRHDDEDEGTTSDGGEEGDGIGPHFQDLPLDLSKSLWSTPARSSVATPLRRLSHRAVLPCDVCGKTFDRPSLLKRHTRTHTGEKPHVCEVCNKGFSTSSSLNTHRRIHSGEKPHECQTCGKRFTASSNLYYHRMTHTKEKPHKCLECGKSFPTPGDLKAHMYIHSGTWPYRCAVCNRGFSKQTNLRNHAFLHTGDRPHPCQLCGKKFALACNLRAHTKTHHQDHDISVTMATHSRHILNQSKPSKLTIKPQPTIAVPPIGNSKCSNHSNENSSKSIENISKMNYSSVDFPKLGYSELLCGLTMPVTNNLNILEEFWMKNNNHEQYKVLPSHLGMNPLMTSPMMTSPFMTSMSLVDLQSMLFMQANMAGIIKHGGHVGYNNAIDKVTQAQ